PQIHVDRRIEPQGAAFDGVAVQVRSQAAPELIHPPGRGGAAEGPGPRQVEFERLPIQIDRFAGYAAAGQTRAQPAQDARMTGHALQGGDLEQMGDPDRGPRTGASRIIGMDRPRTGSALFRKAEKVPFLYSLKKSIASII